MDVEDHCKMTVIFGSIFCVSICWLTMQMPSISQPCVSHVPRTIRQRISSRSRPFSLGCKQQKKSPHMNNPLHLPSLHSHHFPPPSRDQHFPRSLRSMRRTGSPASHGCSGGRNAAAGPVPREGEEALRHDRCFRCVFQGRSQWIQKRWIPTSRRPHHLLRFGGSTDPAQHPCRTEPPKRRWGRSPNGIGRDTDEGGTHRATCALTHIRMDAFSKKWVMHGHAVRWCPAVRPNPRPKRSASSRLADRERSRELDLNP